MLQKPKAENATMVVANIAGITILIVTLVAIVIMLSLQPLREHLRKQYYFEPPEYYDGLPADTEENRAAVTELLAEQDREKAALHKSLESEHQPESSHGRTDPYKGFIITEPVDNPRSLADFYEIEQSACHLKWELLDSTLAPCKSVDQSARAAEHYAHDVENYWIPRLRPMPLVTPLPMAIPTK